MQNSIWVIFLIARFIGNENIDDLWWREHQTTKQEYFEQRKCHLIMQLVKVIIIARERRKIFNILVSSKELLWFYTRHFHRSFTAFLHTYIGTFIPQKNNAPLRAIELWLRLSSTAFTAVSVTRLDFYQTNQIKKKPPKKKERKPRDNTNGIFYDIQHYIFSIVISGNRLSVFHLPALHRTTTTNDFKYCLGLHRKWFFGNFIIRWRFKNGICVSWACSLSTNV